MRRFFSLMISISLIAAAGAAKAENLVTVTSEGWSVTLDEEQHNLSISHETLGTVLTDVGVNLRGERGLNPLTNWSVEKKGQNQLSIRTAKPTNRLAHRVGSKYIEDFQYVDRCSSHRESAGSNRSHSGPPFGPSGGSG